MSPRGRAEFYTDYHDASLPRKKKPRDSLTVRLIIFNCHIRDELPGGRGFRGLKLTQLALEGCDREKLASGGVGATTGLNPDAICRDAELALQATDEIDQGLHLGFGGCLAVKVADHADADRVLIELVCIRATAVGTVCLILPTFTDDDLAVIITGCCRSTVVDHKVIPEAAESELAMGRVDLVGGALEGAAIVNDDPQPLMQHGIGSQWVGGGFVGVVERLKADRQRLDRAGLHHQENTADQCHGTDECG